jgi:flagellin-like protein
MKFQRRRGVSPIIATLLLIAIAVAAGIIVYVFVNGLAGNLTQGGGQQTTERLQMQSYNFVISPGSGATTCGCSGQILELFLLNSGSSTTTISAVYFDGALQTLTAAPTAQTALSSGVAYHTTAAATLNDLSTGTCTTGTGVASDFCFTVAGSAADLTYAVGATGQVAITFASAPTAGTSHTVKIVSTTGATYVFAVSAGRIG